MWVCVHRVVTFTGVVLGSIPRMRVAYVRGYCVMLTRVWYWGAVVCVIFALHPSVSSTPFYPRISLIKCVPGIYLSLIHI